MHSSAQFCRKCGAGLLPHGSFCTRCGAATSMPDQPQTNSYAARAVHRSVRRAKAKIFSFPRFFAMSGISLLGIGLTDGWSDALSIFTPSHGLLNLPKPTSIGGGCVSLLINGFVLGLLFGLVKSSPRLLRTILGQKRRVTSLLVLMSISALLASDAFADDGGIPEMLNGAALGPNIAVLLGTSAAAGLGLSTGIGVVTVIVNGVTTSRTGPRPPNTPSTDARPQAASPAPPPATRAKLLRAQRRT